MNSIALNLPPGAKQRGDLFDTNDPLFLVQDILDIVLPNGIVIDVGWYPESDPAGAYRVVVYKGNWKNKLLAQPIETRDARTVAAEVGRLAAEFIQISPGHAAHETIITRS